MSQDKFDKVDNAASRLGLSNNDMSVLLQVTPVMISRYRKDASGIGRRDKNKLVRAAKALKVLRKLGVKAIREMSPSERIAACSDAVREADPDLDQVKAPVFV